MKRFALILLGIPILLLFGCGPVFQMASRDQDAISKKFSPPTNKASLYIYRNETIGFAIPMTISVNGRTLGQTGSKTYFQLALTPGKYNIESFAENVSNLLLITEPDKNYFVWQEVKMGLMIARSLLQQVDDSTGRAGVLESDMLAILVSENDVNPLAAPSETPATSQVPSSKSVTQKLRELQILRTEGIISEDDFQKKKKQLLEKL